LDFNIGFNGGPTDPTFAVDTLEEYGKTNSWKALRIPLGNARSYEESIEPFFMLAFRAGYKNFHFLLEAPLRKDLEAWYSSDLKTNFTYKPSELDINVPINAYGKWYNPVGFVQFGRFELDDLKISKNDILLGGLPYHDGIHWKFNVGIFRYDFLLSSLNAWLHGDVMDHETGCPKDKDSEAYAQKCTAYSKQVSNQRNRTYTDNVKNLVFHRLGIETNKFWFYLVEHSVIGGKSLEFRSFNPFMYWHQKLLCVKVDDMIHKSAKTSEREIVVAKDISDLYSEENVKIMFRMTEEETARAEAWLNAHPDPAFTALKTQSTLIEFMDPRISKGFALEKLRDQGEFELDEIMAFGDTTNDNSMLETAGWGVCLANGSDDTKAIADDITRFDCRHDGFADYIEEHLFV
jgi:hypothetical protein